MEEDSDDKIRRNLIVVSTAVLLGGWLELPATSVMKRVLGDDIATTVQAWRLWVAVLVVLTYLVLRYKFSHGANHAVQDAKGELQGFRLAGMNAVLDRQMKHYTMTGVEPPAFRGAFSSYVKSRVGAYQGRPEISVTKVTHHVIGKGEVELSLEWPSQGSANESDRPLGFELSWREKATANTRSVLRLFCYSDASTSFLVPVALAALALAISLWRLFQSLI
jgi:hypothetical protein